MKPQARELVLAILSRIQEVEGTANKTKLLKLLYLADIEYFRFAGDTLTGFDWIYFLYGPWTTEYDQLLKQLEAEGSIRLEAWVAEGIEGERISGLEHVALERVLASADLFLRARRQVDAWADRSVPRLLDYVYFETEPMQGAVKMERLDFNKVSKEPPKVYKRTKSGADVAKLRSLRGRFAKVGQKIVEQHALESVSHEEAEFDEKYFNALAVFSKEER